jgi:hypothetical protein
LSRRLSAATAQGIYDGVAVGTMTAIRTLVSCPLFGALCPRAFWVMALLCAAGLPIAMGRISINGTLVETDRLADGCC